MSRIKITDGEIHQLAVQKLRVIRAEHLIIKYQQELKEEQEKFHKLWTTVCPPGEQLAYIDKVVQIGTGIYRVQLNAGISGEYFDVVGADVITGED